MLGGVPNDSATHPSSNNTTATPLAGHWILLETAGIDGDGDEALSQLQGT